MSSEAALSGAPVIARDPDGLPVPRGFSQSMTVGDLVFVSGQLPVNAARELVGGDDAVAQTRQVFHNLEVALKANGLGLQDIVKFTALVVTNDAYEAFRDVRDELIRAPFPTSTVACVTEIVIPGAVIEIDVVAAPRGGRESGSDDQA
jgi:2-iminobutanoate/2-iminopropanoate deaminase